MLNMTRFALIASIAFVAHTAAFARGKPEASDNPRTSNDVLGMMRMISKAAEKRADKVCTDSGSKHCSTRTSSDLMARFYDLISNNTTTPPLQKVEDNLILVHRALRALALELIDTRAHVHELSQRLTAFTNDTYTPFENTSWRCDAIIASRLTPIQSDKYTSIKN